jgi:hypothetical protein
MMGSDKRSFLTFIICPKLSGKKGEHLGWWAVIKEVFSHS